MSEGKNRRERLVACCQGKGAKVFILANLLVGVVALGIAAALAYLIITYDDLLIGNFYLFILPAILACVLLMGIVLMGICGVRKQKKALLKIHTGCLFILSLLAIATAVILFILSGYLTSIPKLGDYFTQLETEFEIQIYNDCCAARNRGDPIVPCDSPAASNVSLCVENELEWSDLVSDALCDALETIEKETFVGNSSGSCGDGDAEIFLDDFHDFVLKSMLYAAITMGSFALLIFITFVFAIFQSATVAGRAVKESKGLRYIEPEFGSGADMPPIPRGNPFPSI